MSSYKNAFIYKNKGRKIFDNSSDTGKWYGIGRYDSTNIIFGSTMSYGIVLDIERSI